MPWQHGGGNGERWQVQRNEWISGATGEEQQRRQRAEIDPDLAEQFEVGLGPLLRDTPPCEAVEDHLEGDHKQHRGQRQVHAEEGLHKRNRHQLANDPQPAQPEQMAEVDAAGVSYTMHDFSLTVRTSLTYLVALRR